jgi:hypothetical protein
MIGTVVRGEKRHKHGSVNGRGEEGVYGYVKMGNSGLKAADKRDC